MNILPALISLLAVVLAGVDAGKLGLFNEAARKALSGYVYYVATSATQYGFDKRSTAGTIMLTTLLFIPTSLLWISLVH
jgi:predicted permease